MSDRFVFDLEKELEKRRAHLANPANSANQVETHEKISKISDISSGHLDSRKWHYVTAEEGLLMLCEEYKPKVAKIEEEWLWEVRKIEGRDWLFGVCANPVRFEISPIDPPSRENERQLQLSEFRPDGSEAE